MSEERDARWAEFETLGVEEIRKRVGAHQYGDAKERLACEWLAHRESMDSSKDRRSTLAEAKAANELARAANDLAVAANTAAESANVTAAAAAESARRSADAAISNNRIAMAALIAAVIAIAISVIGMFIR